MRPATDARWCLDHQRLECKHQRSRGRGQCHGPAVKGGNGGCRFHLGTSVNESRRRQLTAWAAVPDDQGVTPLAAVAGQLGQAWRRARYLGEVLRDQVEAAGPEALTGPLAAVEGAERDRVVRYAERAHLIGVQEHWVAVARHVAAALSGALDGIFDDLQLSEEQRMRIPAIVPARLRALHLDDDDDDGGDAA